MPLDLNHDRGASPAAAARRLALALLITAAGCDSAPEGDYTQPYSVSPPEHPAMNLQDIGRPGAAAAGERAGSTPLPAGHPPIASPGSTEGGSPAAASSGEASSTGTEAEAAGQEQEEEPPEEGAEGSGGEGLSLLGVRLVPPGGWIREAPDNVMRLAQYRWPRAEGDGEDGILTISTAMGSVEENIARWERQFEGGAQAKVQKLAPAGIAVTAVALEGTLLLQERPMSSDPPVRRPGFGMLAAIVEAPGGQLFLKAWGPKATMDRWRSSYDAVLRSIQKAEE